MSTLFTVETFQPEGPGPALRYARIGVEDSEVLGHQQVPLVFVPGLGGSVKNAVGFLKRFAQDWGPVYSLDARGFGLNDHLAPQPRPAAYLQDFAAFTAHLQAQRVFRYGTFPIVLGISLGAVYTSLLTATSASPFKARIMVAPAFCPHPALFTPRFKVRNYGQVLFKGFKAKTTMPYGIRDLTRNADAYDDPNFQDPLTLPTFYLFLVDLLCRKGFAQIGKSSLPTAIILPGQDRICDPKAMHTAYARLGRGGAHRLLAYPELFHDVLMEPEADLEQVYRDLSAWIQTLGATAPAANEEAPFPQSFLK